MERAEGNNKIVLKVLSTLLVMYILTGAALFLLAFLLYKMELTENIVTIGIPEIRGQLWKRQQRKWSGRAGDQSL